MNPKTSSKENSPEPGPSTANCSYAEVVKGAANNHWSKEYQSQEEDEAIQIAMMKSRKDAQVPVLLLLLALLKE